MVNDIGGSIIGDTIKLDHKIMTGNIPNIEGIIYFDLENYNGNNLEDCIVSK